MRCDGECLKDHTCSGSVKQVKVSGGLTWQQEKYWGKFWYCETAIEKDRCNGFTVKILNDDVIEAEKRVEKLAIAIKKTEDKLAMLKNVLLIACEDLDIIKRNTEN